MRDKNALNIIDSLTIRAFRAVDFPVYCEEYMTGHKKVLTDLGIKKLTSAKATWSNNEYAYVVGVWSDNLGKLIGGARIEVAENRLPIEDAVGIVDKGIFDLVIKDPRAGGTAELCGLWTDIEVEGRGTALLLIKSAISILSQIKVPVLYVLCAETTLHMFEKVGCVILKDVGNNGTFYYPKLNLIATALRLPDTCELHYADKECKEKILFLRVNPKETVVESGPKGYFKIKYDLGDILSWKEVLTKKNEDVSN